MVTSSVLFRNAIGSKLDFNDADMYCLGLLQVASQIKSL